MGDLVKRVGTIGWTVVGMAAAVVVAAVVAAVVGHGGGSSLSDRTAQVAGDLRCPTCQALSVAESDSPMAQSMRAEIRRQLVRHRTPEQIRDWFAARYGPQVLLAPDPQGIGAALWGLPVLALAGGLAAVVVVRRRRPSGVSEPRGPRPVSAGRLGVVVATVLVVGVGIAVATSKTGGGSDAAEPPAGGGTRTGAGMTARDWVAVGQSLEHQQSFDAAADAYRQALRRRPGDPAVSTRLAFVLIRAGNARQAIGLVRPLAYGHGPQAVQALLVLGLAQRAEQMPGAVHTLRTFLDRAPHNPAAPQVRRLLDGAQ